MSKKSNARQKEIECLTCRSSTRVFFYTCAHKAAEYLTGMMMYRIPAYVGVLLGDTEAACQAISFYEESRQRAGERVSQTQDP